ncbi:hypothetical protein HPB51_028654 [Rhipicephalus microplus]|uniref:Uncharacterized protein n=1 Tax=Rhipicephalus microplus TaxID=6941 RepID=A0A9J6CX75_RHIMP|nr:hypothetical protein HPB51_028654 [Rhipicephalus microplus]
MTSRVASPTIECEKSKRVLARLRCRRCCNAGGSGRLVLAGDFEQVEGRSASDACYEHVKKVMNLAVLSPYLQSEVQVHMVEKAKRMVSEIRSTFLKALQYSSSLSINFRVAAIRKLESMKSYVGSPGRRLDPEFVEWIYKPYPDAPIDLLFPTWIRALSLSTHYIWTDQTTPLYDEARYRPYYTHYFNDFTVATANMLPPFMYPDWPIALNYGGLGTVRKDFFITDRAWHTHSTRSFYLLSSVGLK